MNTTSPSKNPFAVLRISTQATNQEVVERSRELKDDTHDKELSLLFSKAVEQIITHPSPRLLHSFWEMPTTDYEAHHEIWRKFSKKFKMNPITTSMLTPLSKIFIDNYLHPDRLFRLLAPVIQASRTDKKALTLPAPVTDNLDYPVSAQELF